MKMNINTSGKVEKQYDRKCYMYSKKELAELQVIRDGTIAVVEDILYNYDPLHGLKAIAPPKVKTAEVIVKEALESPKTYQSKTSVPSLAPKPKAPLLHNTNVREEIRATALSCIELDHDHDPNTSTSDISRILEHAREYDSACSAYTTEIKRRRRIVNDYMQFRKELYRYIRDGLYSEAIKLSRNNLSGGFREEVINTLIASARAEAPINVKAAEEYRKYKRQSDARRCLKDSLKTILSR